MNFTWDDIANILETVAAIVGALLGVIAAIQTGGSPFAGDLGHVALTALAASFGLHHSQSGK